MPEKRALRLSLRQMPPLSDVDKGEKDAALRARLFDLIVLGHPNAKVCGLYWPFPTEVDVRPILTQLEQFGRTVALPVLSKNPDVREMRFATWTSGQTMTRSNFSTKEPTGDDATPDLLVVPGLAFDAQGGRLGRGQGYYDATIGALRAMNAAIPVIGLSYERHVLDSLPTDPWDERLTHLVTESRTLAF